jgi:hypothetical protein
MTKPQSTTQTLRLGSDSAYRKDAIHRSCHFQKTMTIIRSHCQKMTTVKLVSPYIHMRIIGQDGWIDLPIKHKPVHGLALALWPANGQQCFQWACYTVAE